MKQEQVLETLFKSALFKGLREALKSFTGVTLAFEPYGAGVQANFPSIGFRREIRIKPSNTRSCPIRLEWCDGLFEMIVPVFIGSDCVGLLRSGPFAEVEVEVHLERPALQPGFDAPAEEFIDQLPRLSKSAIAGMNSILLFYSDYLGRFANELLLEQPLCEPAIIARAKHYIQEHHSENVALEEVAEHVHVSRFYLCKLFKKTIGLTFSEYLVRTRIETAKKLLHNHSMLVNQVALQSGFQSLTHFNRVFKTIVGLPPREYRRETVTEIK